MESILHGGFFHQADHHHHDDNEPQNELLRPPKITLRTMSKSDPHLDIPHLIVSQDDAHPSLNKIMSNLQHVHEGLKTPVSSQHNFQALRRENECQFESSAALLSQDTLSQPPLRKSSSAIDWNGAVVEATRKASKQFDWQSTLFENSKKTSFSNFPHLGQASNQQSVVPSDYSFQGGLVMNTSDKNNQGMSTVATQMAPQQTHFSQAIIASSSAVATASASNPSPSTTQQSSASTTTAPVPSNLTNRQERPTGGVFGMFNRGFFSKPVERSEEENYRYLMALDR